MKWYFAALKKFAECFEGRARRKEFWMFSLFYCIVGVALVVLDGIILVSLSVIFFGTYDTLMEVGIYPLTQFYVAGMVLPFTAVEVRRLHDTNFSGWWLLTPVPLVLFFVRGTRGNNRFGPDPKAESLV